MDINSTEDVNAFIEYKKLAKIDRIEKKLERLYFFPLLVTVTLIVWGLWNVWLDNHTLSINSVFFIAIAIGAVGNANVQRTDLLKQLFELKYGE